MKTRITYKELTIAFGILVASLVIFVLVYAHASESTAATQLIPQIKRPVLSGKNILENLVSIVF